MRQSIHEITIRTRGRQFIDFTREVQQRIGQDQLSTGLATLHIQHTSASLLIQENADPTVRSDLERLFSRLAPDGDPMFEHDAEGDDDMPAHVRTALTSTHLSVPIRDGRLCLGTWQGIYLWEHRTHSHTRRIIVHLLGE